MFRKIHLIPMGQLFRETLVLHNRASDFHVSTIVIDRGSITHEYENIVGCSYILKHIYYNLGMVLKQNKSITNCRMDKYLKKKNVNENEKASNEKKLNLVEGITTIVAFHFDLLIQVIRLSRNQYVWCVEKRYITPPWL